MRSSEQKKRKAPRIRYGRYLLALGLLLGIVGIHSPLSRIPPHHHRLIVEDDPFPVPDRLKPQVRFWKKIFTEYTTAQVVIHDNWYVDVIYEVIPIKGPKIRSRRKAWKSVREALKGYRKLLKKMPRHVEDPEKLSEQKRRIYELFKNIPESPRFPKKDAAYRVRVQLGLADRFMAGMVRAGRLLTNMKRVFSMHGVPTDLVYLALVESGFNPHARSYLGASGMWQFMAATGAEYNLRVTDFLDERKDPFRSTLAAAQLLSDNYQVLRSWPLAISAYNHGRRGIEIGVASVESKNIAHIAEHFDSRRFGFASRNFYAEFLAALEVGRWYTEYYGMAELAEPIDVAQVRMLDCVAVKTLEEYCGLSAGEIRELNPTLEPSVFKPDGLIPRNYRLRLLPSQKAAFELNYPSIPKSLRYREIPAEHLVEKGETLRKIANIYHTSMRRLKRLNSIRRSRQVRPGKVLKIPSRYLSLEQIEAIMLERASLPLLRETGAG